MHFRFSLLFFLDSLDESSPNNRILFVFFVCCVYHSCVPSRAVFYMYFCLRPHNHDQPSTQLLRSPLPTTTVPTDKNKKKKHSRHPTPSTTPQHHRTFASSSTFDCALSAVFHNVVTPGLVSLVVSTDDNNINHHTNSNTSSANAHRQNKKISTAHRPEAASSPVDHHRQCAANVLEEHEGHRVGHANACRPVDARL